MTKTIRCPHCSGLNRADAAWCGQCLRPFAPPRRPPSPPAGSTTPDDADGASRPPTTEEPRRSATDVLVGASGSAASPQAPEARGEAVRRGAFTVRGDAITWVCSRCDSENAFESTVCAVCGTAFSDLVREGSTPDRPLRDAGTAAMLSLFFPGAGHGYVGMWGQAVARAVISIWVTASAVISALQGGSLLMPLVFGVIAFALWVVSAHDAYREASRDHGSALLRDRYFLYVVLGLLVLQIAMVVTAALSARAG